MSYNNRWLLLVSVVLQISNLEAILHLGHFFDTPFIRSTRGVNIHIFVFCLTNFF